MFCKVPAIRDGNPKIPIAWTPYGRHSGSKELRTFAGMIVRGHTYKVWISWRELADGRISSMHKSVMQKVTNQDFISVLEQHEEANHTATEKQINE